MAACCRPLSPHAHPNCRSVLDTETQCIIIDFLVLMSVLFVMFKTDHKCGPAPQTVTRHVASLHSNSHFAGLLSADEQSGDPNHHDDEEHAGADAFDHTTQRLCRTKTFSRQRVTVKKLRPHLRLHSEHLKRSPASVTTGSDRKVSVNRGDLSVTSFMSSPLS